MSINYEWDIETTDPDSGDILDHNHSDGLRSLLRHKNDPGTVLVLVRDDWRYGGELESRAHWYPTIDLEPVFSNGVSVPKRYVGEFKRQW